MSSKDQLTNIPSTKNKHDCCASQLEAGSTTQQQFSKQPGTDKFILEHPNVKSIIINAIVDTDGDAYKVDDAEWNEETGSSVLYRPINESSQQPPIIVQVRSTVDAGFMSQAIYRCAIAYDRYKTLPILLIYDPRTPNLPTINANRSKVFCGLALPCYFWAKECHLFSLSYDSSFSLSNMKPFQALSMFLLNQNNDLLKSDLRTDPTLQRIIQIARDAPQQSSAFKVSISPQDQESNSVESVQHNSPNVHKELVCGMQVKRRFEEVDDIEKPADQVDPATYTDQERYQNTMEFVSKYKKARNRMNWIDCYNQVMQKPNMTKYKNSEVLRVKFSRFNKGNL